MTEHGESLFLLVQQSQGIFESGTQLLLVIQFVCLCEFVYVPFVAFAIVLFSKVPVRLSKFFEDISLQICPGGMRKTSLSKLPRVTWLQEKRLCSFQVN